jgi:hypothetical protein
VREGEPLSSRARGTQGVPLERERMVSYTLQQAREAKGGVVGPCLKKI